MRFILRHNVTLSYQHPYSDKTLFLSNRKKFIKGNFEKIKSDAQKFYKKGF